MNSTIEWIITFSSDKSWSWQTAIPYRCGAGGVWLLLPAGGHPADHTAYETCVPVGLGCSGEKICMIHVFYKMFIRCILFYFPQNTNKEFHENLNTLVYSIAYVLSVGNSPN